MVQLFIYAKDQADVPVLRAYAEEFCRDIDCAFREFAYPMDLLDTLHEEHPEDCAVLFDTDSMELGLEIGRKVYECNPKYRFNLFCPEKGDPEEMFRNGLTYFVNKPYGRDNVMYCMENIKANYMAKYGRIVVLKNKRGTEIFHTAEIIYVTSDKRKVIVHHNEGWNEFYYKLDDIETQLGDSFLRVHQSFVVNMRRIREFVEDGLMLEDETFIPVSRNKHFAAKKRYKEFMASGT